jgi:hypothetical protein
MLLEYSEVYKLKQESGVKTQFLFYIFNYEVLDRRDEEQRTQTAVKIYHAEPAFVSFSDQFDLRLFFNICIMCVLQVD